MAYQALYRRFRPHTFKDVKGQEPIVRTLENQLKTDRIGHAYLFTGTRGTGKTTVARILAAAVNCMDRSDDGSPCGKCPSCEAIASERSMNVIEIDAASNNGIDDIRNLIEEIAYPPSDGRFKVYIIDEVHMISKQAFNALLKTLEEPPEYVIFILATTDVHRVPITILSRCQRYDFKRMTSDTIAERMKELLKEDGHSAEEKGLYFIARKADGSMRDALSLLDQCISFYPEGELGYDQILSVLGAVDTEVFSGLLADIRKRNVPKVIKRIDEVIMAGRELSQFVTDFIWHLRNLLLLKSAEDMEDALDVSSEQLVRLQKEAKVFDENTLIRYIRILSELLPQMGEAASKRALLEIELIRLMKPQADDDYSALIDRLITLEQMLENGVVLKNAPASEGEPLKDNSAIKKEEFPKTVEEQVKKVVSGWAEIRAKASPLLANMLNNSLVSVSKDGKSLMLIYDKANKTQAMIYKQISQPEKKEELRLLMEEIAGAAVDVQFVLNESGLDRSHRYTDALERFEHDIGMKIIEEDF